MRCVADTNILLRSAEPAHPKHSETVTATRLLLERGDSVCVTPQNLIEFWNVGTRPAEKNGLGMSTIQVQTEVERIKNLFAVLQGNSCDLPGMGTVDDSA